MAVPVRGLYHRRIADRDKHMGKREGREVIKWQDQMARIKHELSK
nr:MAG TPA: hypothetical protein [Caudoviricetes sp.]